MKVARKGKRKTSPRPSRTLGRQKKPGVSENLKRLWADPVFRAKMMEKRRISGLARRGKPGRFGVPDGMRKKEAMILNEAAAQSAKETMADLEKAGIFTDADDAAKEALTKALTVMRAPGDKRDALAAARLVLEYTKAKPASKSELTINKAEAWLAEVANNNDDDEGEASKDA